MKKEIIFCDYCGKRITKRNKIKTPWYENIYLFINSYYEIGGDGCRECYDSYLKWMETRKNKKIKKYQFNVDIFKEEK